MPARSCSIAEASPKPFSMMLQPASARVRAMPRPMPLVEPVTTADFPCSAGAEPNRAADELAASFILAICLRPDDGFVSGNVHHRRLGVVDPDQDEGGSRR